MVSRPNCQRPWGSQLYTMGKMISSQGPNAVVKFLQVQPYCHFMKNGRSLRGPSLIPTIPSQKVYTTSKLATHSHKNSFELNPFRNLSIRVSYQNWTHLIVGDRLSILMRDDRKLRNICWMPDSKLRLTISRN